jgi:exopolysaccharide biosynthesis polyprenyl glycosylphosphotransferase
MFRRFSINFALIAIAMDGVLVLASLYLADIVRPFLNNVAFFRSVGEDVALPWPIYLGFSLIWVSVFLLASLYDGRKNLHLFEELSALTGAVLLSSIASAGILFLSFRETSRALFLTFILFATVFAFSWRILARVALILRRGGPAQRRVLIVGDGDIHAQVRRHIENNQAFGLAFVGFVRDMPGEQVIGSYSDIRVVIQNHRVDDVVIAASSGAPEQVRELVNRLHDVPVHIWTIPDYLSLSLYRASMEEYAGIPMFDLRAPALSDPQRLLKRGFDLIVCLLLLPVALVVMGAVSVLIALFDARPVVFNQARVGENGRVFTMHKFRTMKAVNTDRPGHKTEDDPRVTRLGRFLRRSSLDELPQLFNVLKGEMSLVGPRPEMPQFVEDYENWQRARFVVPPGITGWWQVNGRSDRPLHLNIEDDIYYIKNYSLWLDILILVRTAWVVLLGRGAY